MRTVIVAAVAGLLLCTGCGADAGVRSASADDGPIGGGAASGTGLDLDLACPEGIDVEIQEWYGAVGHDMDAAVDEGFGDLAVGSLGDRVQIAREASWATWGLRTPDGAIIAELTVFRGAGGWDPSHARYCDIRPPQPIPAPFTLYVSNQSFEDASVGIEITIDGDVVVDEVFDVEGQHNWKTFTPDIAPGEHLLRAESNTGVVHEASFVLADGQPLWAVLDYWWYPDDTPRQFGFATYNEPVGFG